MSEENKTSDKQKNGNDFIDNVSKRFIIEVFFNGRRLEYRASNNETELKKELEILKKTYKSSNCVFYFGFLNAC